jgi:hypothetical protein
VRNGHIYEYPLVKCPDYAHYVQVPHMLLRASSSFWKKKKLKKVTLVKFYIREHFFIYHVKHSPIFIQQILMVVTLFSVEAILIKLIQEPAIFYNFPPEAPIKFLVNLRVAHFYETEEWKNQHKKTMTDSFRWDEL